MTQRYLEDFAVGQILTPPPARGVWHPDNPKGNPDMVKRTEVEFQGDGFVTLRGWLYTPELGSRKSAAITMSHGFAGVKEQGIEPFAKAFAGAGFVVLLHDHRNFGASDGFPRNDVNPWTQIADWRRAISYLESRPEVDPARIGLWGTSYSAGTAEIDEKIGHSRA